MAGVVQAGSDGPTACVAPGSSSTPAFDAPPQPHDVLVAWVYASGAAGTLSTPPGWTKIGEANGGLNAARIALYCLPDAAGSDPAPTFTTLLVAGLAAQLLRYVGHDTTSPIATSATAAGTIETSLTATAGVVNRSGCLALTAIGRRLIPPGVDAETPGAGWTNKSYVPSSAKFHYGGDGLTNPPVGAPLSELVTVSSALGVGFALILAVFQPPAGGGLGSGESYVYYDGMTLPVN